LKKEKAKAPKVPFIPGYEKEVRKPETTMKDKEHEEKKQKKEAEEKKLNEEKNRVEEEKKR